MQHLRFVLSVVICTAALYGVDHYYCSGSYFGGLQKMAGSILLHVR